MTPVTKRDIREILWSVTDLGGTLTSADDDALDDAELTLDSLTLAWVVVQLEKKAGHRLDPDRHTAASFRSVHGIFALVSGDKPDNPASTEPSSG